MKIKPPLGLTYLCQEGVGAWGEKLRRGLRVIWARAISPPGVCHEQGQVVAELKSIINICFRRCKVEEEPPTDTINIKSFVKCKHHTPPL